MALLRPGKSLGPVRPTPPPRQPLPLAPPVPRARATASRTIGKLAPTSLRRCLRNLEAVSRARLLCQRRSNRVSESAVNFHRLFGPDGGGQLRCEVSPSGQACIRSGIGGGGGCPREFYHNHSCSFCENCFLKKTVLVCIRSTRLLRFIRSIRFKNRHYLSPRPSAPSLHGCHRIL